jgi:hypothetical protein
LKVPLHHATLLHTPLLLYIKASKVCRSSLKAYREANALKLKGIDSEKEKEWNEDLSSTIKETYKSMKGRRKCQVQTCYQS